eukprot:s3136_g14.t1
MVSGKEKSSGGGKRRKFGASALGHDEDSDEEGGTLHPHGFAKWPVLRKRIFGILSSAKTDWFLATMILSSDLLPRKGGLRVGELTCVIFLITATGLHLCMAARQRQSIAGYWYFQQPLHGLILSDYLSTPNCPSRGEIPKILFLAWGKVFVEVVAMRRLGCVWGRSLFYY